MAISDYSATEASNSTVPGTPTIQLGMGYLSPQAHLIQTRAIQRIMADLKTFSTSYVVEADGDLQLNATEAGDAIYFAFGGTNKFHMLGSFFYPENNANAALGTNTANYAWGRLFMNALSADPADPANGLAVLWISDGTESGSDGDFMMKITDSGGTTKTATLVDFSAI